MSRSTISGADGDDNAILHASLLSGSLSIKVIDTDIRRDVSHHLLHAARIETDYILQVDIGAQVDVHTKTRLCETLTRVVEMDEYFCSKRYDDVRQLAHSMRGNAEDVVKYYNAAAAAAAAAAVDIKQPKHTRGGSSLHGALLKKTAQAVRYIHNSECASSPMRMSDTLDQSSPAFVREVLVGVDEFCEEIRSVKRQRGGRTKYSWSYVKSMSERRKATINRAFTLLIQALSRADLSSVSEERPGSIPVPLKSLIRSLETFLLTDVIVDLETEKTLFPQQNIEKSSSANTAPRPLTIRGRSSFVDRMAEERTLQEVAHDILLSEEIIGSSEKADDRGGAESSTRSTNSENWAIKVPTTEMRLLPCHPTDFGIIVAAGVVFFKAIEGRALNIQLDALVTFGFLCGLLGRQWTLHNIREGVAVALHQPTPKEMGRKPPEPPRPRPTMHKASGSINLSTQRAHRFSLIQKSLRHLGGILKDTETSVVPAKTFQKLPDGAAIGHHNNCWSSPPSEKFHVRGPTYLKDKAKVPSANYLFPCRGCDLFLTDNAPVNVGRNRSILGGKLRDVPTFIINYRLPWGIFVSYHEIPERFLPFLRRGNGYGDLQTPLPSLAGMSAGERSMCNFLLSDTDVKNNLWKLVPVVVDGPWVVKRVVGGKPAIVGTKLPITYVYQPPEKGLAEYFEADLDIVSSAAARNVLAVVRSYTQVLTIDLGYVVQGSTDDELPEQMMLGLRLHGLDPLTADLLPDYENVSTFPEFDGDSGNETD